MTEGYKKLQGVTRGDRGPRTVTGGYKRRQRVTKGYKG